MGIYNASGTIADKTSEFIDNMDFARGTPRFSRTTSSEPLLTS